MSVKFPLKKEKVYLFFSMLEVYLIIRTVYKKNSSSFIKAVSCQRRYKMQNTVALCCSCRPRDKSVQDPDIKLDQSESRLQSDIPTGLFHRSPGQFLWRQCSPFVASSAAQYGAKVLSDIKCVCV